MRVATDILGQIATAGLMRHVVTLEPHGPDDSAVRGVMSLEAIAALEDDPRFAQGGLHLLHADVGHDRTEFRAHPGEIGHGSLQIVIDKASGRFYADIDRFNPYSDVVNSAGHAFGEVVPNWLKKIGRLFRRKKQGR